jgi:asparagine synthase (glutamine-hydrolysing)
VFGYARIGEGHTPITVDQHYAQSLAPKVDIHSNEACCGWSRDTTSAHGITVFLDGRPHASDAASTPIDARLLIDLYLRDGREFLARLNGSFAIVLFDARTRELTLAVDRMGIATLAWAADSRSIVFSNSAADVAHRPNATAEFRSQAIYDYFFFHMVPSPESVFVGVKKLAPGTALVFAQSGQREYRYWTPNFSRSRSASFDELKAQVHHAMEDAVRGQYTGPGTGAFLSGGLDSSSVTGYLARVSPEPAQTFSMGFGVDSFDELEFARATNRHFGCNAHEYDVTPDDILEAIPIVASVFDEPFGNSSAIPTFACARLAKQHGMHRLLAGDGGDEIFGGNERYARHQIFELFNRLPSFLRNPIRALVQSSIDPEQPITALRKLRSYIDQASIPLPQRYESWNFVYREGAKVMFREDFMRSVEEAHPIEHMKTVYQSTPSNDLLDCMLFYDWKFTLADNDLRKVTAMCDAANIEVAFPMLDNRVVEMSTRVPSAMKMRRLELRTFYKRAMTGFLPDVVLQKKKHGFGLPFGQWLKTHAPLSEMVYGSLSDLKRRSIVKASFIDQIIEDHRHGNAGYFGYAIWDLVILEQWMKHQSTRGNQN